MKTQVESKYEKGVILLVDDEEVVLDVCSKMLQRLDYQVLEAKDGQKAIEVFKKNKNIVNLVILDMRMPGMDGSTVYDHLKKIKSDVKVLLASGYFENRQIRNILNNGHDDLIQKPFNIKQLSEKLEKILV